MHKLPKTLRVEIIKYLQQFIEKRDIKYIMINPMEFPKTPPKDYCFPPESDLIGQSHETVPRVEQMEFETDPVDNLIGRFRL